MCVSLAYVYIITCTCINVTHFCGIMHLAYIIYIYIEGGGLVVGVRESEVCVFVCVWVI